jgi:hypothetical protein
MIVSPHPVPARGALRDRHGRWARDAMDAFVLSDVQQGCGRQRRVGLAPQWQVPSPAVTNGGATETTKPGLSEVSTR